MNRNRLLLRLAVRGLRRSRQDYTIYFVTVALTTSLIFAFNAVALSPQIHALSQMIGYYMETIELATLVVVAAVGLLIDYNARFLLEQRGPEFAVCLALGMERRQAALLFLGELVLMGAAAGITGIGLGALLFQLLAAVFMSLFQWDYHLLADCFLPPTLIRTGWYFLLLYLAVAVHTMWSLRKGQPFRKPPKPLPKRPASRTALWTAALILSLMLCVQGIFWLLRAAVSLRDDDGFGGLLLLGIPAVLLGILGSCAAGAKLLPRLWQGRGLLKDANLFLARQLSVQLGSNALLTGIQGVLITLSLALLGLGCFYGVVEMDLTHLWDMELMITIDDPRVDFSPQLKMTEEYGLEDWAVFTVAKAQTPDARRLFQGISKEYGGYYQDGAMTVSLTDFNSLIRQAGLPPLELGDAEFLLSCNTAAAVLRGQENLPEALTLGGTTLTPHGSGSIQTSQGRWTALLVLPDAVYDAAMDAGELEFARKGLAVTTRDEIPEEDASRFQGEPLFVAVTGDGQELYYSIGNGARVDENGRLVVGQVVDGNAITLVADYAGYGYTDAQGRPVAAYADVAVRSVDIASRRATVSEGCSALFYLGIVFGMIAAAILAVRQLSDRKRDRRHFRLLMKLGLSEDGVRRLTAWQLAASFGFPLLLPAIVTIVLMLLLEIGYVQSPPFRGLWILVSAGVLGTFLTVYGGYFLLALLHFQRNILEE